MKALTDLMSQLLERTPLFLVVLAVALFAIGAAGGVTYHNWFPIPDTPGRVGACAFGLVLLASAIYLAAKSPSPEPQPASYSVKITYPPERETVDIVNVQGAIKRRPPADYVLMALRLYPGSSNAIYPMSEATLTEDGRSWTAANCNIGGQSGDARIIGIYLVGPSGQALLRYFKAAESVHGRAIQQVSNSVTPDLKNLPLITDFTRDMIKCAQVLVRRK